MGYIPSFCTACYRQGRTGDRFMELVKSGHIGNICQPNALITLQEYLEDYANLNTKIKGESLIENEKANILSDSVRLNTTKYLQEIKSGRRDMRF